MRIVFKLVLLAMLAISLSSAGYAAEDYEFVATVNGTPITKGLFEINLHAAIAQGQKDTPQLRDSIRNELINRELIVQEANRQGLDKDIDMRDQIAQLRQTLLVQAFVGDYLKKNPITEDQLKAEYEKQKESMGGGNVYQYKLSQIVLPSESAAIAIVGRLQSGESFAKVAKEISSDAATKNQGGVLGWVRPQQVAPAVSDVMVGLEKGQFSTHPIKLQGSWVVIQVDDKRSTKFPGFAEVRGQLRQAIIQQYLVENVKHLRESAKIVQ